MRALLTLLAIAGCSRAEALSPAPMPAPSTRPPLRRPGPHSPRLASYRIEATLDTGKKTVTGQETLIWKHAGVAPVTALPLHLYMNAFKNEDTVFMKEARGVFRRAKREEGSWGSIDVSSVRFRGQELRPAARFGVDESTLEVPLPQAVQPGETVELEIAFVTTLPIVFARTGWRGEFFMVGQWFPKIGVLDVGPAGQKWHCEPFHANSEFYADFGVYDVGLTVPDTEVVAATGVLTKVETPAAGQRRHVYHAEDVHDFAWMADPHMRAMKATADGDVDVVVWHRPEQEAFARRHLEAAARTVETYGRLFGEYPFTVINVIDPPPDAAKGAGGMEYPMFVTTSGDNFLLERGVRDAEWVTVHEVGHNWFQGVLASNEVDEAFLDEGVNEYATGVVLDEWFGPDRSISDLFGTRVGYFPGHQVAFDPSEHPSPIAIRSYDFPTLNEYGYVTYAKTAVALKTLENLVGREAFLRALGVYTRRFAFRHPTGADFFGTLGSQLGVDAERFLQAAFQGRGGIDYRVADVRVREAAGEQVSEVLVHNVGQVAAPLDVELVFADGARERRGWDGRGPSTWIEHRGKARLVEVRLDPDGKLLLEHEVARNGWREPYRRPAWRAAARAGFWEQTLLSVVGL